MEALKMVHIFLKKETVQVNVTMRSADFSISLCRVALAKVSFQRMLSKKLIGFLDPWLKDNEKEKGFKKSTTSF